MFIYSRIPLSGALLSCGLLAGSFASGSALAADTAPRLSWPQAAERLLESHPTLAQFHARKRAADGERQTAMLRPGLNLGLEAEDFAGTGDRQGIDATEFTLSLSSVLELGNQRDARIASVDARYATLSAERRLAALDLLATLAERYLAIAVAKAELDLVKDEQALIQRTLNEVRKGVNAGASPKAELWRANAELQRVQIQLQTAAAHWQASKVALAALWGQDGARFSNVALNLSKTPAALDTATLFAAIENHPDFAQIASERRLLQAEYRAAKSNADLDLNWSVGVRRSQADDSNAFVVGISLPLFGARRNTGEEQRAAAAVDVLAGSEAARSRQMRSLLIIAAAQYDAGRQTVLQLRSEVVPALKRALDETRAAYQRGRYSYLDWVSARRELLDARRRILNATKQIHQARLEIERLIATPLQALEQTNASPIAKGISK